MLYKNLQKIMIITESLQRCPLNRFSVNLSVTILSACLYYHNSYIRSYCTAQLLAGLTMYSKPSDLLSDLSVNPHSKNVATKLYFANIYSIKF